MSDTSHWNFARAFTGEQAANLILGPSTAYPNKSELGHVLERLKEAYDGALARAQFEVFVEAHWHDGPPPLPKTALVPISECLQSEAMLEASALEEGEHSLIPFERWLEHGRREFGDQKFGRHELSRWLSAAGLTSAYAFSDGDETRPANDSEPKQVLAPGDQIDPDEFPDELVFARQAFAAVHKGYGAGTDTPTVRLRSWLAEYCPHLSKEAIKRISIVANTDKAPGRKRRVKN